MNGIRLPEINAATPEGQLRQIRSYLIQLVPQLEFALQGVGGGSASGTAAAQKTGGSASGTGTESPESAFNRIKSLIIKSADIINAYYEEISARLEGEFVASSEFGSYKEETELKLDATSTDITQIYTSLQAIYDTIEGIEESSILASAYIKTGLLYYGNDGAPVYGLEIGQTNSIDGVEVFDKFARFAANRLSFFDANDVEVAYISDYRLHITNAEISGNLSLGPWIIDTSNGLAFKWGGIS